jgi:hypothetical protein
MVVIIWQKNGQVIFKLRTKLPYLQVWPFPRQEIRSSDILGFVPWKSRTCCNSKPRYKQSSLDKRIVSYMLQKVTTVDIYGLRNTEVWECWSNPKTLCSRSVPDDGILPISTACVTQQTVANMRKETRVKHDANICGRSPKLSIWNEGPATHSDDIIVV